MKSFARRLFEIGWRLSILALSWQTRWFSDSSLMGWSWEQGRWSFYVSWMFVFATGALGVFLFKKEPLTPKRAIARFGVVGSGVAVLMFQSAFTAWLFPHAAAAITQWWIQVIVLGFFVWTLWRAEIKKHDLAMWFVFSLIPHAMLGAWQSLTQEVVGQTMFGMSPQLPEALGVSVVSHDGLRILRAYGGFPHPNIFGGWLAVGVLASAWLAATSATLKKSAPWMAAAGLFAGVLVLTYARSAWIAVAIGSAVLLLTLKGSARRLGALALGLALIASGLTIVSQREHVFARFDLGQRLEQKSVDARTESLRTGWMIFRDHPFIGTGPNAELFVLSQRLSTLKTDQPLEPPHNVYLLALVNFGILGILALLVFLTLLKPRATSHELRATSHALVVAISVLALFDHYLWSLWAGQALVAAVVLLSFQRKDNS